MLRALLLAAVPLARAATTTTTVATTKNCAPEMKEMCCTAKDNNCYLAENLGNWPCSQVSECAGCYGLSADTNGLIPGLQTLDCTEFDNEPVLIAGANPTMAVTQTAGPGVSVVVATQDASSEWNHWYTVAIAGGSITVLAGMAYATNGVTANCEEAAKFIGFEGHETAAEVEGISLL